MTKPVIYFVDDEEAFRVSMRSLLEIEGFDTHFYSSSLEILDNLDAMVYGCVVVDFNMPGIDGLQLIREMRKRGSNLPFVLVSGCATIPVVVEGMRIGATTILEKPFNIPDFLACIRSAAVESKREQEERQCKLTNRRVLLTPRENEVLDLVVSGQLTKNIARQLGISTKTVEVHRSNITKKYGVNSVAQLIRIVIMQDSNLQVRPVAKF